MDRKSAYLGRGTSGPDSISVRENCTLVISDRWNCDLIVSDQGCDRCYLGSEIAESRHRTPGKHA